MRYFASLLFLLVVVNYSYAQDKDRAFLIGDLLEKANQQRMLTQKIAKIYTTIYLSSNDINARRLELNEALSLFEQQHAKLKMLKINLKYHQLVDDIEYNWQDYIELVNKRPSKENLLYLLELNNTILDQCNMLVEQLTQYALRFSKKHQTAGIHYDIIQLENTAGHQRMLSQRILFYYLAYQVIIEENKTIKTVLDNSLATYESTLLQLINAPLNSPEIDYRLRLLSKEWSAISKYYRDKVKDITQIEKVIEQDNNLLSSMNTITELYGTLVDQQATVAFFDNAIDMANQQCILTQKMTANYFLLGRLGNQKVHGNLIKQQIDQFEYHIDELKLFAPADEITNALNKVDLLWTDYRNILLLPSQSKGAHQLLSLNKRLLNACEHVTELLSLYAKIAHKYTDSTNKNILHWRQQFKYQKVLAASILMYSQAIIWNINSKEENIKSIETTGYTFIENLNNLNLHLNNKAIQLQIQTHIYNWRKVKPLIITDQLNETALQDWANDLPAQIDQMVLLFEQSINQVVAKEAIEIINHQALLSQQITSTTIAISMGLNIKQYEQQLQKYNTRFQANLDRLNQFAASDDLKELISMLQLRWKNYQSIVNHSISKDQITMLLEKSSTLLATCTKIANHIQEENRTLIEINQVAQLRTLTEQILVFMLIERWGVTTYQEEINALLHQFSIIKSNLVNNSNQTTNTVTLLNNIDTYYNRLHAYHGNLQDIDLYSVLLAHNNLLIQTDQLTQVYTDRTIIK